MIIEFTGIPGAGKSTLIESVRFKLIEQGLTVQTPNEYIFSRLPISPPSNPILSILLIDIILIPWIVRSLGNSTSRKILTSGLQEISRSKNHLIITINLCRNFLKKLGITTLLKKRPAQEIEKVIILWDEGITHSPQLLFVNSTTTPDRASLSKFIDALPLPNLVLFLDTEVTVALDGVMKRGSSWKIPGKTKRMGASAEAIEKFLHSSKTVFDLSLQHWNDNPNSVVLQRNQAELIVQHIIKMRSLE
jgi:thymidylate kinase